MEHMEQTPQRMPAEIAKAVVQVMGGVKKLAKDARNEHGKYNYVSVDQFFSQVGALMHEAGIFVIVDEAESQTSTRETVDSYGKAKTSAWLENRYEIFVYHESGASYGPIHRTIQVSATGPQSYGSAISFVEKYFLRSLFKIPTGEQDADADAQEGLPARQPPRREAPERPSMLSPEDSAKVRSDMLETLAEAAGSRESLLRWAGNNSGMKSRLQKLDADEVGQAFVKAQAALKAPVQEAAE